MKTQSVCTSVDRVECKITKNYNVRLSSINITEKKKKVAFVKICRFDRLYASGERRVLFHAQAVRRVRMSRDLRNRVASRKRNDFTIHADTTASWSGKRWHFFAHTHVHVVHVLRCTWSISRTRIKLLIVCGGCGEKSSAREKRVPSTTTICERILRERRPCDDA